MPDRPTMTIGMAHYDDYDGVWATLHALRRYHDLRGVQLLVVDNSPHTPHGASVADLCQKIGAKYVPLPDAVGTSVPRDRVFAEADGAVVLCMDCHVLIDAGGVAAIRDWFANRPESKDMLCGPLLHDNGTLLGTQFNDFWRAEMWGVWGSAWECGCVVERNSFRSGAATDPSGMNSALRFSPMEIPENGLRYVGLVDQQPVTACPACGRELPAIGWAAHERALLDAGYTWLGLDPRGEPFEVLGQGLGLFAMRRDAWVGFNPHARGFGGEELYVHTKVRRAGGRVLCHPAARWTHRFGRVTGITYPIGRYTKVRNYVLEFQELGLDLAPIEQHFVATNLLARNEWDWLLADPIAHDTPPGRTGQTGQKRPTNLTGPTGPTAPGPAGPQTLDTLHAWAKAIPRDLDQHADRIRELAGQASHITAIVKRREWDVFLLAGHPDDLVVYTTEPDLQPRLHEVVLATEINPRAPRRLKHYTTHVSVGLDQIHEIEDTDLLAIDTIHHADQLTAELAAYAPHVRQRIVLRGTQAFGEKSEDKQGPGLLVALRQFMREHPEWSVIAHYPQQYGLTVISRDPADKPPLPGVVTLAKNFAKAIAEHVADGLAKVSTEELQARLEVCTLCDQRNGDRCAVCGCYQGPKASMRSSVCPLGKWCLPLTTDH